MALREVTRRWCAGVLGLSLVVVACDSDPDATASTAAVTTTPTTVEPERTTQPPLPPPTTLMTPVDSLPIESSVPTTTPASGTGEPPQGVAEAAGRGTPAPLERPTGFARFEPAAAFTEYAPLTGLPFDPELADLAALAVKIDNAPGGQPQYNLADADLVFEENVEGVTRFVAVFHSNMPDRIGPVRSARTSDLDILAALNRPILAWSGGNAVVTLKVRGAHEYGWLANLSAQRTDCFWRSSLRGAPHNLMLDPECARESATFAGPARPVFANGYDPAVPDGEPVDGFDVEMSGIVPSWRWDPASGRYLRSQRGGAHVDVDGERIAAANVVVLSVEYVTSEADEMSPEAITVGSGPAVVHRDGVAVEGTWSRPDRFSPYALVDLAGRPIPLAPGTTWVELPRWRG